MTPAGFTISIRHLVYSGADSIGNGGACSHFYK